MSEKELREFAKETAGQYAPDGVRELCRALLAADPDVVDVARVCRRYDPGPAKTRGGKLYNEGWRDAVNAVADNLERKYGFRLTDKSYEWTEEPPMSELRTTLGEIVHEIKGWRKGELVWLPDALLYSIENMAQEALDETTAGPTQMQQLVEWLEQQQQECKDWKNIKRDLGNDLIMAGVYQHEGMIYRKVLDHIRTKFLGEEKTNGL